jgi:DNA-binding PadR family transcriptional regulator
MKGSYLGEFEEIVLLAVAIQHEEAYGYAIGQQIEAQTGRSVSLSAVHSALHRLEKKEFLTSRLAGATTKRGGKRRRFFAITSAGKAALQEAQQVRQRMWTLVPPVVWETT